MFVLLATLLSFTPVGAQQTASGDVAGETPDTTKMYAIGEVVVTANRHRFNVESAMPAQILTGQELEKLNSLSVADAIRYFWRISLSGSVLANKPFSYRDKVQKVF